MRLRILRDRWALALAGRIVGLYRGTAKEAEAAYFDAGEVCGWLGGRLTHTNDPAQRATLIRAMAGCHAAMGAAHTPAFGPDPNEDEGGRDVADSDRLSADLLYLLADVEESVARGHNPPWREVVPLTDEAWSLVQRMAETPDLTARAELTQDFARAATPTVGGQAAETVFCLYPSESEEVSA